MDKRYLFYLNDKNRQGMRVDKFAAEKLPQYSRSQFKQLADFYVNNRPARFSQSLKTGDQILINFRQPPSLRLVSRRMDLNIIYEDNNVLVLNKPAGMVCHPAPGHYDDTLVNGLLYHFDRTPTGFAGDDPRPGIVHRLDRETSGVIITAKNIVSRNFLAKQFADRRTKKLYLALVKGHLQSKHSKITTLIGRDPRDRKKFTVCQRYGKAAETHCRVRRLFSDSSLLALAPITGRTHQLRVHMRHINCPIIGDDIYGGKSGRLCNNLLLHATALTIQLPGHSDYSHFTAPLPEYFCAFLKSQAAASSCYAGNS